MTETYTNRHIEYNVVKDIEGSAITSESGWTAGAPAELASQLRVGDEYVVETRGSLFGQITGWQYKGEWYGRRSDEQIEADHKAMVEGFKRERQEMLDANREDWTAREALLPKWLKDRLDNFRIKGGTNFELDGWGYELVICELAALYWEHGLVASGDDYIDPDPIKEYAKANGTSGNQHDVAQYLVREHMKGKSLAGTISGLSPLTGDPYYVKGE